MAKGRAMMLVDARCKARMVRGASEGGGAGCNVKLLKDAMCCGTHTPPRHRMLKELMPMPHAMQTVVFCVVLGWWPAASQSDRYPMCSVVDGSELKSEAVYEWQTDSTEFIVATLVASMRKTRYQVAQS